MSKPALARLIPLLTLLSAVATAVAAEPLRILYVGNSYTFTYNIPAHVHALAQSAGVPAPTYTDVSQPSWYLATHRASSTTLGAIDNNTWDVVVLQEQSLRPTNPFAPAQFKQDAAWLYDRVKAKSPNAQIVLYETWARAPGDALYPGTFVSPSVMQSQLRFHYNDAATNYIPTHVSAARKTDVTIAPVGDAWERELATFAIGLHDADLSHPNLEGSYLTSLVLFSTIYHIPTTGLDPLYRDPVTAAKLQSVADATTPEPATVYLVVCMCFSLAACVRRKR